MSLARLDVFQRQRELHRMKRSYSAGANDRITGGWLPSTTSGDTEIQQDIRLLRDRSRDRERNGGWPEAYYRTLENNIVGSTGPTLQMQVKDMMDRTKPDVWANEIIEENFWEWCTKEYCTVTGEDSWVDALNITVRSSSRDGGVLIRRVRGGFEGEPGPINKFGYAIQLLEIDLLDINYTTVLPNGNYVFMGVEKNPRTRRPVRYWLLGRHPGETIIGNTSPYYRVPYEASEIIHYFNKKRITQSIGVPDLSPVGVTEKMLDRYEEAEVVAAAEAAMKGGFIENPQGMSLGKQDLDDGDQQENGSTSNDLEPGAMDELGPGQKFIPYDPTHPTDAFSECAKHFLRKFAATGGISYASLTGDLEGANYSSLRAGKKDEQETYKARQNHLIRHVCEIVFADFLKMSLLSGVLKRGTKVLRADPDSYRRYNSPMFMGRRWDWVDPEKDARAALMLIDGGLGNRTEFLGERGRDFEDNCNTLATEKAYADSKKLEFVTPQKPPVPEPVDLPSQTQQPKSQNKC